MPWDDDLDREQAAVASDLAAVIRLVAGPGTGKTRVMTRRIAHLIDVRRVEARRILALTFSRAAARELRQRLEILLGEEIGDRPAVSTLHAFALRQLIRNRGAPTLPRPILIADDFDERYVIQEELRTLTGARSVREIRREIQNLASDWETLAADDSDWEHLHPNPRFLGAWRRHREIYGYTLRAELVYAVKKALEQDLEFELEVDFEHLLVDEYQDLNPCEMAVVRQLRDSGMDLFVGGDDDQSIYGFRNAFPLGLREFVTTHSGATERELSVCHRCDRSILDLALGVVEQDISRIPKELRPREGAQAGEVAAYRFNNISHEASGIAEICDRLIASDGLRPVDVLILLRNDPQGVYSEPIIRALRERKITAELPSDPYAALDEGMGRELVCMLRLLRNRRDGLAWRELLELRDNGLGSSTLMQVYRLAAEQGWRYSRALNEIAADADILGAARMRNRLAEEVREINSMLERLSSIENDPAESALRKVLEELGANEAVSDELLTISLPLMDDDATLTDLVAALQSSRGSFDEEERQNTPDRVQIMTMHAAKGLTAEAVIVAACEDELLPGAADEQRQIDDERRLLYVSLTRAKHHLFVTYAGRRAGRQSQILQVDEHRTFTQFLRDLLRPQEL